ncbi:MAG: hypothetical protein Q9160_005214 [Pyrenula sp. 1 TL-2023]
MASTSSSDLTPSVSIEKTPAPPTAAQAPAETWNRKTLEKVNDVSSHLGKDAWEQWRQWMAATAATSFDKLSAETFTVLRDALFGRPTTHERPAKKARLGYHEMEIELFFFGKWVFSGEAEARLPKIVWHAFRSLYAKDFQVYN